MKISIIIPTLNEEKLLEQTLLQFDDEFKKNNNIELIVSDGGSKDKTIEIAKKYADKVVLHETNKKQNISVGRNFGAKHSNGELLIFFNADTLIKNKEKFIESVKTEFEKKNIVGITCSVFVYQNESIFFDNLIHSILNYYFYFLNIIGIGMGRGECNIVRKEMFILLNGYNEKIYAGEDYDFFFRLRKYGKIFFLLNETVYESPRRYRKYGYLKILFLWFFNAVSVSIFKKSYSNNWDAIR